MYHFVMRYPDWKKEDAFHLRLEKPDFFTAKYEFLCYCNSNNIKFFPGPILTDCTFEYGVFCP